MPERERAAPIDPTLSLPVFERIAPAPPAVLLAERIEALTRPGDIVLDVASRGGWTALAASELGRRTVLFEASPLTRLLAELVLRPPDLIHLDAAFQAISAASRPGGTLRSTLDELFASRCARCGRTNPADELLRDGERIVAKRYRCPVCREGTKVGAVAEAPADAFDEERAHAADAEAATVRARLRSRFALPSDADPGSPPTASDLPDALLDLHSSRQLVGLAVILERVEGDLRSPGVEAALRLALLHAILPASRLNAHPGRGGALRIASGRVRPPTSPGWRERHPWLAFEDGFRLVRGFILGLTARGTATSQPRFGTDVRSLAEGGNGVILRLASGAGLAALAEEIADLHRLPEPPRVRLVVGQVPPRANTERLSLGYLGTCWALGRGAASLLPLDPLFGPSPRVTWDRHGELVGRGLAAAAPLLAADGRTLLFVDEGGAEGVTAAALGAVEAGYRIAGVTLATPGSAEPALVQLAPPGPPPSGSEPPTELRVGGGAPLGPAEIARLVTETAVAVVRERGEPAPFDLLLGAILVRLDGAGELRRLLGRDPAEPDRVGRLLGTIRTELARPGHPRLEQIEPGSWWLVDRDDRAAAEPPLADRVEWAVFGLLSTAGALSETAFAERIGALFPIGSRADDALVRACLDSYRGEGSSAAQLLTDESLARRSAEHAEVIGLLADLGHRLGMSVAIGKREQARIVRGSPLAARLDARERATLPPVAGRASAEAVASVDCTWYVRSRRAFMFEVEWTALLAEPVLRKHAGIPPSDDLVRFLVLAPERVELARFKLARSPLLRRAMERDNWHILTWENLGAFASGGRPRLEDLEPYLGLDAGTDRRGDQLALFETGAEERSDP